MQDLSEIRERINRIDEQISELFLERMEAAADVAEYKRSAGKAVFDRSRERDNIARAAQRVPENLANYAALLEYILMAAAREVQYQRLGLESEHASPELETLMNSLTEIYEEPRETNSCSEVV